MFGLSIHGRYSPPPWSTPAPEPREWSAALRASYSYLLGEFTRLVESGGVRKFDPGLLATQLWITLHGFILLELGGYFATVADPASAVLVPMCIKLIGGLGANRQSAEASAAAAMASWTN